MFAALGTPVALGALGQYEEIILGVFQGFALVTLVGLALSVRQHHNFAPLIVGTLSCAALAYHFYRSFFLPALYSGLFGLSLPRCGVDLRVRPLLFFNRS